MYRSISAAMLATVIALPASIHAQRSTLSGMAVDSVTGAPLIGVTVTLLELDVSTATEGDGTFEFFGIPSGEHTLALRRLGYEPIGLRFQLNAEGHAEVDLGNISLTETPTEIAPVNVEGAASDVILQRQGFYRRQAGSPGTFFTEEDILRERPQTTSDLFRRLPQFSSTRTGQIQSSRSGFCRIAYFLNGIEVHASSIDAILPEVIIGAELYSGTATVPIEFTKLTGNSCGAVVIWTRHTRREPSNDPTL